MKKWVVDCMNVVGSTPDGWWRDRKGAIRRLIEGLDAFAASTGDEVTVVVDGRSFELEAENVDVVFAPTRGRNAADDEIARMVAAAPDPHALTVVTSDRELVERVRAHGAEVVPARAFRSRLSGGA